jgi:hypothetical protein
MFLVFTWNCIHVILFSNDRILFSNIWWQERQYGHCWAVVMLINRWWEFLLQCREWLLSQQKRILWLDLGHLCLFTEREWTVDRKGRILGGIWVTAAAGVQTSVFQEGGAENREQEQESLQEHSAMWVVTLHIKTILTDHIMSKHPSHVNVCA